MDRYTVIDGSYSAHCCFEASVIDSEHKSGGAVCECIEKEKALKIARALNIMGFVIGSGPSGRDPKDPHMSWCPQREQYLDDPDVCCKRHSPGVL